MKPNFFTKNSPFLAHPLLTDERTAAEIDFVLRQSPITADVRFLDVGCGFGRHSLELARRGYHAVGIDPARAMIEAANGKRAALEPDVQPNVTFKVADGESFRSAEAFDVALCLMTTLGQVGPSGENSGLLTAIQQNLRPGGKLILEVPQKRATVENLKAADHFGTDTHYTKIKREFDETSGYVVETFAIVSPESQTDFLLSYRLFSQSDIEQMLADAGFQIESLTADFVGNPLTEASLNMVFVASN